MFLFAGCKTLQAPAERTAPALPAAFSGTQDSGSSANINWRSYFGDSILVNLIDEGLKNNPDLYIAFQKAEVARANVMQNRGALFPSVSGNISLAQRKFGLYTMDGAGNISTYMRPGEIVPIHLPDYYIGLQTSWEADIWGKLRNKRKSAFARYLSGMEGVNFVRTNLVADIANAYYELLGLDNQLSVIHETIKIQEMALELVTLQKQSGAANQLAVEQFSAQLLRSQGMEYETRQRITVVENRINFLVGRFPQKIERDANLFNRPLPVQPTTGLPADLIGNRPDIRQAELELAATKADTRAAKAAFYPSLNITGAYGFQAFKSGLLFLNPQSVAYTAMGNLLMPLINRSAIKANFTTATARQQEALCEYQRTILTAYIEVYNELSLLRNLEKINELKSKEVDVFTKSIETSSELFKTNRATYLEVLMTQKNTLEARIELLEAKKRQFHSMINIYKALGGGWR